MIPLPAVFLALQLSVAPTASAVDIRGTQALGTGIADSELVHPRRPQPGDDEMRSDADRWFAEDKLKHFFVSFAATSFAFSAARSTGLDRTPALATAATGAAVVGVGKEWYDRRAGRPFSYKDIGWDALGIVAGVLLLASVD